MPYTIEGTMKDYFFMLQYVFMIKLSLLEQWKIKAASSKYSPQAMETKVVAKSPLTEHTNPPIHEKHLPFYSHNACLLCCFVMNLSGHVISMISWGTNILGHKKELEEEFWLNFTSGRHDDQVLVLHTVHHLSSSLTNHGPRCSFLWVLSPRIYQHCSPRYDYPPCSSFSMLLFGEKEEGSWLLFVLAGC